MPGDILENKDKPSDLGQILAGHLARDSTLEVVLEVLGLTLAVVLQVPGLTLEVALQVLGLTQEVVLEDLGLTLEVVPEVLDIILEGLLSPEDHHHPEVH